MSLKGNIKGFIDNYLENNRNNFSKKQIGSFGELVFAVSTDFVHTFDDLQRNFKGKWGTHDIIANKPVSEFLSADLEELSFKVLLFKQNELDVNQQVLLVKKIVETGLVFPFILAGSQMGDNNFYLESADINYKHFDTDGIPIFIELSLKLKEYITVKREFITESEADKISKESTSKQSINDVNKNNQNKG